MKLDGLKLKGEKRILATGSLTIYIVFMVAKLIMFPDQTLLWHLVTGLLGFLGVTFFLAMVLMVDNYMEKYLPYETNAFKRVGLQFLLTLVILLLVRFVVGVWIIKTFHIKVAPELLVASIALNIFFVLSVILSLFSYRFFMSWKREKIIAAELEKEKAIVQYDNLKNQLNPHFLFNSLTSLNSLIFENPQLASEFLQQLSRVYRYVLENKDKTLVTLSTEEKFISNYIKLLMSRFESGLKVNVDVKDADRDKRILPVTLQILVENAIKHNIISKESPLQIDIYSDADYLVVKNNLQVKHIMEDSNKQGLENLRNLYHILIEKEIVIEKTASCFSVKIPLI